MRRVIVAEATGKSSTAARMEEFVFERVAEDCNLTLDVGVCLGSPKRTVNDCAIGSRRYALFLRLSVVNSQQVLPNVKLAVESKLCGFW